MRIYPDNSNTGNPAPSLLGGSGYNIYTGARGVTVSGGGDPGSPNIVWDDFGTIGGGSNNIVGMPGLTTDQIWGTIAGGHNNKVLSAYAAIGGGYGNTARGAYSAIPGGIGLTIGNYSFGFAAPSAAPVDLSTESNIAAFVNVDLWLYTTEQEARQLRLYEPSNYGIHHFSSLQAQDQSYTINYLLPESIGNVGDVLTIAGISGSGTNPRTVSLQWTSNTGGGGGNNTAWLLLGNSATNPAINFLGTTDSEPLVIRTNNTERLRVTAEGRVGIGTSSPAVDLHVHSSLSPKIKLSNQITGQTTNDGLELMIDPQGVGLIRQLDSNALELYVGGGTPLKRALRIEPTNTSPNIVAGYYVNAVTSGAVGATIHGGGGPASANTVNGSWGSVAGGAGNTAGVYGSVGGGKSNSASGELSFIGGGEANYCSSPFTTIAGGRANRATGLGSTIGGGDSNSVVGDYSFAAGRGLRARSYIEMVLGSYNDTSGYTPNPTGWSLSDRLFIIGNGSNINQRSNAFVILKNGNIGIGTNQPSFRLHISNGDVKIEGKLGVNTDPSSSEYSIELPNNNTTGRARAYNWDIYSSILWKTDIQPIARPLDKILQIRGVRYRLKPEFGGNEDIGFIGEELRAVVPEIVHGEGHGLGVDYARLTAVLVEALKEMHHRYEQLYIEFHTFQTSTTEEVAQLRSRLVAIESLLTCAYSPQRQPSSTQNELAVHSITALLGQNIPNPFDNATIIPMYISSEIRTATLEVVTLDGRILNTIVIPSRGETSVTLSLSNYSSGTYQYRLIVDGMLCDTRIMQLNH